MLKAGSQFSLAHWRSLTVTKAAELLKISSMFSLLFVAKPPLGCPSGGPVIEESLSQSATVLIAL
jgi:hypothetical protein